jgi:LAO/AO transport system kinase
MQRHYLDDGVFIRSMATRGSHGGLSKAVRATASLLDAFGKDVVIIETVGVGQTELGIAEIADTTVLVMVPESGDGIQAMKAGVVEIADIIVVNKADREGAERLADELRVALVCGLRKPEPVVITTQAVNDVGIEEVYEEMDKRRKSC